LQKKVARGDDWDAVIDARHSGVRRHGKRPPLDDVGAIDAVIDARHGGVRRHGKRPPLDDVGAIEPRVGADAARAGGGVPDARTRQTSKPIAPPPAESSQPTRRKVARV